MPIELKICGINSKSIIETIVRNGGCQYLGFIFYPPSPRHLSIQQSKELTSIVPYYIKKVAVLVKPEKSFVEKIKNQFDYLQVYDSDHHDDHQTQRYELDSVPNTYTLIALQHLSLVDRQD